MKATQHSIPETSGFWRSRRRRFLRALVVVALAALGWGIENWRGRRVWEECKRELAAKGEVLDWSAYVPPPLADEQNMFKAPLMMEWMQPPGANQQIPCFSGVRFEQFVSLWHSNVIAEVSVMTSIGPDELQQSDLVLHYNSHWLFLAATNETKSKLFDSASQVISVIEFAQVPLATAIENLARQAGLNWLFDPGVTARWRGASGQIGGPMVTIRWENLTAREALYALLGQYGLRLEDAGNGVARITSQGSSDPWAYAAPEASARLLELTRRALPPQLNAPPQARARGTLGYTFVAGELPHSRPLRLIVLADVQPTTQEVADFFPRELFPGAIRAGFGWRAISTGSNSFRVYHYPSPAYAAADYLAWSDQFQPEFDRLREALQRPGVRPDADYERPDALRIPNSVCVRQCAQILSQRVQCHLLQAQPDAALEELTLMYDLRRLFSGKPVPLIFPRLEGAFTGLYLATLAEGLRLQAWRDPDLVALQQQLQTIHLLPNFRAALGYERAALCQTLQVIPPGEFAEHFDFDGSGKPAPNWWKRVTDPMLLVLKFAPRGWVLQNLAVIARTEQLTVDIINPAEELVDPAKAAAFSLEVERIRRHRRPHTFLVGRVVSDFTRSALALARNQTRANQALIACGLERYRRAHGNFPERLDALLPQFVPRLPRDVIGGQPLHYRRTDDGQLILYSVGWNTADDGGKSQIGKDGWEEAMSPDWVWNFDPQ